MTRFTRPDNWQDLLAGYILGDLGPDELELLQQMLSEHPDLITEVDRLQETLALMPYALPEHTPPAHLRDTILQAAAAERPLPPLLSAPSPSNAEAALAQPQRQTNRWLGWAGLVAAVVLLGLGLDNLRLRQQVAADRVNRSEVATLRQELADRRAIVAALQSSNARLYVLEGNRDNPPTAAATGSIVLDREQNQVVLVAENLPSLPDGQAYRLWAMPKNSQQPAYCGQFNSNSAGTVSLLWQAPKAICSNPAQLLITAESATAPPVPQGKLAMKSRV